MTGKQYENDDDDDDIDNGDEFYYSVDMKSDAGYAPGMSTYVTFDPSEPGPSAHPIACRARDVQ